MNNHNKQTGITMRAHATFEGIMMNVNQQQAEAASRRLQDGLRERLMERLRNSGLITEARVAVYP